MESWKGNRTPSNPQEGYYVGLMNACGYRTKDLEKPVIGIVNSFTTSTGRPRRLRSVGGRYVVTEGTGRWVGPGPGTGRAGRVVTLPVPPPPRDATRRTDGYGGTVRTSFRPPSAVRPRPPDRTDDVTDVRTGSG